MTVAILMEKNLAARHMAAALGGVTGNFEGADYVITAARGHVYEFKAPEKMVPADQRETVKSWDLDHLPWDHTAFSWERSPRGDVSDVISRLKRDLSGADEIAVSTDLDPTGEGDLIAWEIIQELGLEDKKITRLYFVDESEASLAKAFRERKELTGGAAAHGAYRKALLRSKFDLLTMQSTRVASAAAQRPVVLRQGRLKSAMVYITGEQLKAYNEYKKVPFYQNRFRDENGVVYSNPEEPMLKTKDEVPGDYTDSPVVVDGTKRKATAPPKLLDLAKLSAIMASKGVAAAKTASVYQKMYEAQVVSYPRTEDKTITPEQFNELLPMVDKIADVVGANKALLTHRSARTTHVKPQGAHGANRPGPKVPSSLSEVERTYGKEGAMIYDLLGRNYLAMLAEDYTYDQITGHLEKYPDFTGSLNVAVDQGFKAVFSDDEGEEPAEGDEDTKATSLGSSAAPFIHEGFPPRPARPTQGWLMNQLDKRDVGTGATRNSIFADVSAKSAKFPLIAVDTKGRLSLSEYGQMSYLLLPKTRIGDLSTTEQLMETMRAVEAGEIDGEDFLASFADWVRDDISTMKSNGVTMRDELSLDAVENVPRVEGTWQGKKVAIKRKFSSHEFTDDEMNKLFAGEELELTPTSAKSGNPFYVRGALAEQTYQGKKFVGFKSSVMVPMVWAQHKLTLDEVRQLLDGKTVTFSDCVSKKGNKFEVDVTYGEDGGEKKIIPHFKDNGGGGGGGVPKGWSGHTFTDAERKDLEAGKTIYVKDFISKAGKKYGCAVKYAEKDGQTRKSIIMMFDDDKKKGSKK